MQNGGFIACQIAILLCSGCRHGGVSYDVEGRTVRAVRCHPQTDLFVTMGGPADLCGWLPGVANPVWKYNSASTIATAAFDLAGDSIVAVVRDSYDIEKPHQIITLDARSGRQLRAAALPNEPRIVRLAHGGRYAIGRAHDGSGEQFVILRVDDCRIVRPAGRGPFFADEPVFSKTLEAVAVRDVDGVSFVDLSKASQFARLIDPGFRVLDFDGHMALGLCENGLARNEFSTRTTSLLTSQAFLRGRGAVLSDGGAAAVTSDGALLLMDATLSMQSRIAVPGAGVVELSAHSTEGVIYGGGPSTSFPHRGGFLRSVSASRGW